MRANIVRESHTLELITGQGNEGNGNKRAVVRFGAFQH